MRIVSFLKEKLFVSKIYTIKKDKLIQYVQWQNLHTTISGELQSLAMDNPLENVNLLLKAIAESYFNLRITCNSVSKNNINSISDKKLLYEAYTI